MMKAFVVGILAIALLGCPLACQAQDDGSIQLPKPATQGGMPLMQALKQRQSLREFSEKELPLQVLSDLLWAAFGINRPESGGRTAPSARNRQEIDIYVATRNGLYVYDALENALVFVLPDDIRAVTGGQPFIVDAPVDLIYVADHKKMEGMTGPQKEFYAAADTGFISQNVYLYCASSGLATVVRGSFRKIDLSRAMKLRPSQTIILTQTVGYPAS
jgi:nitroreductase